MEERALKKEQAEEILRNMERMNPDERAAVATIIQNVSMVSKMVETLRRQEAAQVG